MHYLGQPHIYYCIENNNVEIMNIIGSQDIEECSGTLNLATKLEVIL